MTEAILQPHQPAKFQSRNMRPKFRRLRAGDLFLVEQEVEESVWNQLRTVPEDAIIENVIWWHQGDDGVPVTSVLAAETIEQAQKQPAKNGKPEKGPHGAFYTGLFKQGFQNSMELLQVLGVEQPGQVKDALHTVFQTDTLTTIQPERFMEWAEQSGLNSLVTMCRQIQAKVKE